MSISTMSPEQTEQEEVTGKKSRKKLLAVGLVLLLAAGAWWFLLRPPADTEAAPVPGEVLKLDAIQLNLEGGHYLRIGIALQASVDAGEHFEGSKALDATIDLFSGQRVEDLAQPVQRKALKRQLLKELEERYHGEVIDVYFTDFVTQ